jgi:hypothetical protein
MAKDKNEKADGEHEKEVEEEQEEDEYEQERKQQYLDFRRTMDEFKGEQEGMVSESESFKKQGNAYFTFGCYSQATIMYSEALDLQPHSAVLYCNRAMAYLKQDLADLALKDACRSLEIDSTLDNIKAYWRKAQALLDLKRYEEAVAAAGEGLELHGRNPHLNKVRRKAREANTVDQLMAGDWVGTTNHGLEQRLSFSNDGEMKMTVFGHSLIATYELSVEGAPRSMVVKMKHEVGPGSPPPPPMVYIFKFLDNDKELWLCHPVDGSKDLPTEFAGPGLVKHRCVAPAAAPGSAVDSREPVDVRCAQYMREMNKVLPLVPPQLPEKPSDQQIKEEVEICGRVSELKNRYGLEVHRRAVELAKEPSRADGEEMQELAQQLRRRFTARKLLEEEPKVKKQLAVTGPAVPALAPAPATATPAVTAHTTEEKQAEPSAIETAKRSAEIPSGLELLPSKGGSEAAPGLLSRLVLCICGGNSKKSGYA